MAVQAPSSSSEQVTTAPLQSSVQRFEPVDGYATFGKGHGGRSNRAVIAVKIGMVALACVAIVALTGGLSSPQQVVCRFFLHQNLMQ